jgi:diaminopimelate epimerase
MTTAFLKMNGLGNDFIVFDARKTAPAPALTPARVRALADRRRGIGCDQLIVIEQGSDSTDALMRIYNADGGEVAACGNATRCIAALLFEETGRDSVTLATRAGALVCRRAPGAAVAVEMGVPRFDWQAIPLAEPRDTLAVEIAGNPYDGPLTAGPAAVDLGNPHIIFFVPDAGAVDLARIGPALERHPLFPERVNVSFAQVTGENTIRLRVWERGVGITMACGTAACAAAVTGVRLGLTGKKTRVTLDGGGLDIVWEGDGTQVIMTGPVATNFAGVVELANFGEGA